MASWFKDEILELKKRYEEKVAAGITGQPLADQLAEELNRSPRSITWALSTYLSSKLGRAKHTTSKAKKPTRLTTEQRKNLLTMARTMIGEGVDRDKIIHDIGKRFCLTRRGVLVVIGRGGVEFPEAHKSTELRRRKTAEAESKAEEVRSGNFNIDIAEHPYYIAASILNRKPGIKAEVRNGVCYRNGFPWSAAKFLAEAGVQLNDNGVVVPNQVAAE
ncbi:hypothetical protein [Terasakiella pusilla]|uniref:hypothetical protein n=1 Tax=Terasakiella pusilla TaxID=64973 RepID=UPI003AA87805